MILTCTRCGRKHPLSEEDVVFFHPRFFCLSCGEKVPFPIDDEKLSALRRQNDRERKLAEGDLKGTGDPGPLRVRKVDGLQGTDGG